MNSIEKNPFENLSVTLANAKKKLDQAKNFSDRCKCEAFFYANIEKPEPLTGRHWSLNMNNKWELMESKIRSATLEEPEEYSIYLEADVCMIVGFDDIGHAEDEEEAFKDLTLREYLRQYGNGEIKDLECASVVINEGFEYNLNKVWNQKVKFGMKIFIPSEQF